MGSRKVAFAEGGPNLESVPSFDRAQIIHDALEEVEKGISYQDGVLHLQGAAGITSVGVLLAVRGLLQLALHDANKHDADFTTQNFPYAALGLAKAVCSTTPE